MIQEMGNYALISDETFTQFSEQCFVMRNDSHSIYKWRQVQLALLFVVCIFLVIQLNDREQMRHVKFSEHVTN